MPFWPLAATIAVQTLATMALYSMPTLAPAVATDLGVPGTLAGGFVAIAYGVGVISALISPGLIRRHGGVRATQAVLLSATGMVLVAVTSNGVAQLALAALVLGLAYGAAAPASTHLLVPHTPRAVFNMVMSLRQIGVPLGGVCAALLLPPLVGPLGWRGALATELIPVLALILLMELPRRRWDADREPSRPAFGRTLLQPFQLLSDRRIRRLSFASFIYSGLQLTFVAFMTVHLTSVVRLDLVTAGRILAVYQISGSVSRPIWGWVADRYLTPAHTLAVHGVGMAVAALLVGQFGPSWPVPALFAVVVFAGCTACAYTGVAYAEFAALGGTRRTEATGLGTAVMFSAVMLIPPAFGAAVGLIGGYGGSYVVVAALALLAAGLMAWPAPPGPR
ncbi:MAG: MFS transporter [Acetobacteraceae bacterium]